ncbi:MAG: 6-phosphofructokinase [Myxococcota bacterium]
MGSIQRVGLVFAGGPAPAANAVISAAAMSFVEAGREVIGFFHGYSNLQAYGPERPLIEDKHYRVFRTDDFSDLRNSRGVIIGTSRVGPGQGLETDDDLRDRQKTAALDNVYRALVDLRIDALISIGGDGTLRTAMLLHRYQGLMPETATQVRIVHVPKTIDNDYRGIDFTFGYFTAVDVMAKELQNLRADGIATSSYFIVETMGRKAGWLSYGVAIAGEANWVVGPEDVQDGLLEEGVLDTAALADRIVDLMVTREGRGKHYGTVVLAEGLGALLPGGEAAPKDHKGDVALGGLDLGRTMATLTTERYLERTGRKKKIRGVQLGYESRSALPHAYDVMLASQLGIGAYRALVEESLTGHMISVRGQFELEYVPFETLQEGDTIGAEVRYIQPGSDFHRLARFLETRVDLATTWTPGRRRE